MWKPNVNRYTAHKHQALIDCLRSDIAAGRLSAGQRLPTQSRLARETGIAKSTIARAYQDASTIGLIDTVVGRGSFVRREPDPFVQAAVIDQETPVIDFRIDYPLYQLDPPLAEVLARMGGEDCQNLLTYQEHGGEPRARAAGCEWMRHSGVRRAAEEVVIAGGAQHAVMVSLATVAHAGQTVLVEELTYPGVREAADMLGLDLVPVVMDEEGVIPGALVEALHLNREAVAFYTCPTMHNPTTILTSSRRREEIAAICARQGIYIIEDDVRRMFADSPPNAYAQLLPELTFFISSFSKVVCGGLRIAYLAPPTAMMNLLMRRLLATHWTLPPLMAEIATRWIDDGTAMRTFTSKRAEAIRRRKRAGDILGQPPAAGGEAGLFMWLDLPASWPTDVFITEAMKRDVAVLGDGTFRVLSSAGRNGVRLCLGAERSMTRLESGLSTLKGMLDQNPVGAMGVI